MEKALFPSQFDMCGDRARLELRPLLNQSFAKSFLFQELHPGRGTWVELADEVEKHKDRPKAELAGLIFHTGKTGSVLAANMLNEIPGCAVLKEPDTLVQVFFRQSRDEEPLIRDLRGIISLMGYALASFTGIFVIKWSSWTALHLATVTKAFPGVPICFLYRDPAEVLASNILKPTKWSSPRRMINNMKQHASEPLVMEQLACAFKQPMGLDELVTTSRFYGSIMARIFESVESVQTEVCLVKYTDLPEAAIDRMAPYFGLHVDENARERMMHHAGIHSHSFGGRKQPFQPDGDRKKRFISTGLQKFLDREVSPRMRAMENARRR